MAGIQVIRGMHDVLPEEMPWWQWIEDHYRELLESMGYRQIRTPILEKSALFHRSIGEVTDIVEKEMYSFDDRNGESLSLRPEGTASVVRAAIENGLLHNQQQRLWYFGPMFRHERPQKGRYRQFHQLGAETFGMPGADIEAELMLMVARFWKRIGLQNLELQINSLGTAESRLKYRSILIEYLQDHAELLDEDAQRRLHSNPLRILDSKNPDMQAMIEAAPQLAQHLDQASQQHFGQFCELLDQCGLSYVINPRLVRGLDYYSHSVFEWVSTELGSQGTVCAGGRYDGLVEQLGGKATTAAGFAMGVERLVALLQQHSQSSPANDADVYLLMMGDQALKQGFKLAEQLRDQLPKLKLYTHCGGGSFKSQMKKADKSGATHALLLGESEVEQASIVLKPLRNDEPQTTLQQDAVAAHLQTIYR